MKSLTHKQLWLSLCCSLAVMQPVSILAEDYQSTDQRLQRLERMVQGGGLSEILMQMQSLRSEVQQLRGQVEMQQHSIDNLTKRQREMYSDLDQRLAEKPSASVPDTSTASTPAESPAANKAATTAPAAAAPAAAADPAKEKAAYDAALALLKAQKYKESAAAFAQYVAQYPKGTYASNAQYWLAESYYVVKDYDRALKEFDRLQQQYPTSAKLPSGLLKKGYILLDRKQTTQGKELLQRLIKDYPGTTEARLAKERLDKG